jgi:hypothetical protein
MAQQIRHDIDPRTLNIERLVRICGNDVFGRTEEYKRLEAARLGITGPGGVPVPIPNGSELSAYIPKLSDPIKIICCKAHVFRDSAGQGHFQNDEAWRVVRIFGWANMRYGNVNPPSDVPTPPLGTISDTRIRFQLRECDVSFYDDTTLHTSASVSAVQAAAVAKNPNTLKYLNIYYTNGNIGGGSAFATLPSALLTFDSWAVMLGVPFPQSNPSYSGADWAGSNTLAHELGHVLGELHTYSGGGASAICNVSSPDYLFDVFGTNPSTCPHICNWAPNASIQDPPNAVVTNNLMGGNKDNFWVSPLQAAIMYRSLKNLSVRRYVATGCNDCASCVAFTVRGANHVSSGTQHVLTYANVDLNETSSWTGGINAFVAPISGIYHFGISFVGSGSGGASADVSIVIRTNGSAIARAKSVAATGQRGTGSVMANVRLQAGDIVDTASDSGAGITRNLSEYTFEGHLICGCC